VKTRRLITTLPADLLEALDEVCQRLGLRKNFVVEAALREKIENLLDAEDLREAVKQATGFHAWEEVKAEVGKGGRE
jgi:metal-responsive CopG/Arc/MetJ family transcriptional regulator